MRIRRYLTFLVLFGLTAFSSAADMPRYVACTAFSYGLGIDTSPTDTMTTKVRFLAVAAQFDDLRASPAVAERIAGYLADPLSEESRAWSEEVSPQPFINSFEDAAKSVIAPQKWARKLILDPEVWEFVQHANRFAAALKHNIPLLQLDEKLTTYAMAGLRKALTPQDLEILKQMIVRDFERPSMSTTPSYSFLLILYGYQTDDIDFFRNVWENYPDARSMVLMCCTVLNKPEWTTLGVSLANEAIADVACYKNPFAELNAGQEQTSHISQPALNKHLLEFCTRFMQTHRSEGRVTSMLSTYVSQPGIMYEYRPHMIWALHKTTQGLDADQVMRMQNELDNISAVLHQTYTVHPGAQINRFGRPDQQF